MPIVYANIPQSIYCSRLTYLPSCLGFFHTGDPSDRHAAHQPISRRRLRSSGRRDYSPTIQIEYIPTQGAFVAKKFAFA